MAVSSWSEATPRIPVLASAELWDSRSETFSLTGSLAEGRSTQTATLLADGRVLVVGGDGTNGTLTTARYRASMKVDDKHSKERLMKRAPLLTMAFAVAAAATVGGSAGTAGTLAADLSPSAGTIVFARADQKDAPNTLYTIEPDGTGLRGIEDGFICCAQWSSDGKRIQFVANAPDGKRLTTAVIDPDGSHRVLVALPDTGLNLGGGTWTAEWPHRVRGVG